MTILETQGLAARHAERVLAVAGTAQKNRALEAMARALKERESAILAENQKDLAAARESGMKASLLDRLALSPQRIDGIVEGVRQVAALPDPIGCVTRMEKRPNGLVIGKRRVPLGVIGIIYEARPNVTVDAAALCLKSGNAVILRGGKEAFRSNRAFVAVMRDALEAAGLPRDCVALVEDTSRASAQELMGLTGYLDVLIPRGGAGLIRTVVENARVPVIETGVGVCHVYVDEEADLDMGARIIYNAKTSRPSVCNAAECLLVHAQAAEAFLPKAKALLDQKNVELRGCPRTCAILGEGVQPACEADWDTEFGDYILAVKVVEDFSMEAPKTKEFLAVTKNLSLEGQKILLVLPETNPNVALSARNLQNVKVVLASNLNTYDVMNAGKLVLSEGSVNVINQMFGQ